MLEFNYDHENDGVFVSGTDTEHGDDANLYINSDELEKLFECLMVDRIKEIWVLNQNVNNMLSALNLFKKCENCDGVGHIKES